MDCPSCGHANRPQARFCGSCGQSLEESFRCPSCGDENPPGQHYCDGCGHDLSAPAGDDASASPPPVAADPRPSLPDHLAEKIRAGAGSLKGERKQVSVLFADVVGSMELATEAGPEAWREIMGRLFSLCCDAVHRFEGSVDKFTGDGVMALFGAPITHEDHAQRACYAALQLQEQLADYAAELRRSEGLNISLRIGINSGAVIAGEIGDDLGLEYTAIGETVGLAQRMEQLAEPGKAYLAEDAAGLVEGYLELRDLGEFEVKGAREAMHVHELVGIGAARGRLDISRRRGFSKFVGRGEEMGVLESALERVAEGNGQVIGLVGEAGVGKSRLCHEFAQHARGRGMTVYHAAAQAHAQSVPLMPVLGLMRTYFDITERDSDQTARERIAGKLLLLDEEFAEDLPLMFDFLSVPDVDRPPPPMDPEVRQRKLLTLTKRLARAQSAREPGLTVYEDLHWIDPASEAFLANHIEAVQGTRSLVVVNFRPQYSAEWMGKSYYRQIPLTPLGSEAIEELLDDLLGSHSSLDGLSERISERTGGNPFFIEEVVQSLVEAGSLEGRPGAYSLVAPVDEAVVPASVEVVLSARIDRLEEREKAVLQTAAVIGKEFSTPVLSQVAETERSELDAALRTLTAAEFVYEQEIYPEPVYAFKHPLTQEVAYGSQLAGRRAEIHAAVARALAEERKDRINESAALLAHHWEAAGEKLEAARWHAIAAAWTGTSDSAVSLGHWRRVRALSDELPDSEETAALGLAARIFLLQYGWRLGISEQEAETVFHEAEAIASKVGDVRSRAMLLSVYASSKAINDGDVRGGAELARRSFALAEETGDADLYMTVALTTYAIALRGEYREATKVLDRAVELADGDTSLGAGVAVGCPYGQCVIFKGGYSVALGELREARRLIESGMKIALEHGDLEVAGWGHLWSAWLGRFSGLPEELVAHSRQALEISERLGTPFSRSWSWFILGMGEQAQGNYQAAFEAIERSRSIAREERAAIEGEPQRLAGLAEVQLGLGDIDLAMETAGNAIDCAREQGNTQGELLSRIAAARILLAAEDGIAADRIEELLAEALDLADRMGARGILPMLRVLQAETAQRRGEAERAMKLVTEAHSLFTEIGADGHAAALEETFALGPESPVGGKH